MTRSKNKRPRGKDPKRTMDSASAAAKGSRQRNLRDGLQHRLPREERRSDILQKAVRFFAEVGFEGGTRQLAYHLGTTQPLLYRYFPTKEALIREVYQAVYLAAWKPHWDELLVDRQRTLRDRLQQFYEEYCDVVMTPEWIRIYLFAGLKRLEISPRYIRLVEERILRIILVEFWHGNKLRSRKVTAEDLEVAWTLQSAIFYYGVRRFVYQVPVHLSKQVAIARALEMFFGGCSAVLQNRKIRVARSGISICGRI